MRHQGQKDLKADQDNKVIGSADARKDGQKVHHAMHRSFWYFNPLET